MKICSKCRISKTLANFDKDITRLDGFKYQCKGCIKILSQKRYLANSEAIKERNKAWPLANPEKARAHCTASRNRNPNTLKAWRLANPKYFSTYVKNRSKIDPLYKLARALRNRTSQALKVKFWQKNTHFAEYIGCTLEELKLHIEKQFTTGMTWQNHGKWHVDHIIPLASAKTVEELIKLCHYTNLQPLWAPDNLKKSNKIL